LDADRVRKVLQSQNAAIVAPSRRTTDAPPRGPHRLLPFSPRVGFDLDPGGLVALSPSLSRDDTLSRLAGSHSALLILCLSGRCRDRRLTGRLYDHIGGDHQPVLDGLEGEIGRMILALVEQGDRLF
jgi:hypothetical protein